MKYSFFFILPCFSFLFVIFSQNCSQLESKNFSSESETSQLEESKLDFRPNVDSDRVWIGPMAFGPDDTSRGWAVPTLRPNFSNLVKLQFPQDQIQSSNLNVFKTYIMILPTEVSSDSQLRQLINDLNNKKLKVAFEVGGMRTTHYCGERAGNKNANDDLVLLNRWVRLGGKIDYLTTDHSIMSSLATPIRGSGLGNPNCKMTLDDLITEQINYFAEIKVAFPNIRIGMIESLGFFNFSNPKSNDVADQKVYFVTDLKLPGWNLDEVLSKMISRGSKKGIKLDHFHIDFSLEGVEFDGRTKGGVRIQENDYGRILLALDLFTHYKIRAGIIVNADGDSDQKSVERTLQFLNEIISLNKVNFDHIVLQTWFKFPRTLGRFSSPFTGLGLIYSMLTQLNSHFGDILKNPIETEYSPPLSEGIFLVDNAIFYANFLGNYCLYNDWEKFILNTGITDTSKLRRVQKIPNPLFYDGICVD